MAINNAIFRQIFILFDFFMFLQKGFKALKTHYKDVNCFHPLFIRFKLKKQKLKRDLKAFKTPFDKMSKRQPGQNVIKRLLGSLPIGNQTLSS